MLSPEDLTLFENSLKAENPTAALSDAVRQLHKQSGKDRQEILDELEEYRNLLRAQGRDAEEDVVLEVMDFLVGWSSPHVSLAKTIPAKKDGKKQDGASTREGSAGSSRHHSMPLPRIRMYAPGTRGILVDRCQATFLRDHFLPPTAVPEPTVAVLDLTGVFPSPSFLQDMILPLAQRIHGGVYGQLKLAVITHDTGVADFLGYLAHVHNLALFVATWSDLLSPAMLALHDAQPVGDLTSTERTTLNVLVELGGTATASDLARVTGIEPTAAGNRLVNLTEKGFLYRFAQPQREGYIYVDPRSASDAAAALPGAG